MNNINFGIFNKNFNGSYLSFIFLLLTSVFGLFFFLNEFTPIINYLEVLFIFIIIFYIFFFIDINIFFKTSLSIDTFHIKTLTTIFFSRILIRPKYSVTLTSNIASSPIIIFIDFFFSEKKTFTSEIFLIFSLIFIFFIYSFSLIERSIEAAKVKE